MLLYLEKISFYLFVFCLPFGLRKVLYQFSTPFNQWTSIYLYLTDVLLFSLLFLWFWRKKSYKFLQKNRIKKEEVIKSSSFWLCLFLIVSFISLARADNFWLGLYCWIKLLEFTGLFFYLRNNLGQIFSFKRLWWVLITSGIFQAVVALFQYGNQRALGWWFLGESPIGVEVAGVAKITVDGLKMVRAYGSFPHPNILAAFLLFCLFSLCFLWLKRRHSFNRICFFFPVFCLLFLVLLLTFSRLTISIFLLFSLFYFAFIFWRAKKIHNEKLLSRLIWLAVLFLISCSLSLVLVWPELSSRFTISLTEQSVSLRSFYNETALSLIGRYSWLGIGTGNFIWQLQSMLDLLFAWAHQPVHNIYLLIASENGLLGLVLFLMFVFCAITRRSKADKAMLFIVFSFLSIGLFDHFFWTIQQGQLMFWLVLGLVGQNLPVKDKLDKIN